MTVRLVCLLSIVMAFAIPAFAAQAEKSTASGYVQPAQSGEKAASSARVPVEGKRCSGIPASVKSYDLWIRDVDGGVLDRYIANPAKKYATSSTPHAKAGRRSAAGPVD